MKMIDPTYLRTIHDGLLSGVVHKDNASALPFGLVGMYEEAIPPSSNVNDRDKFLDFFTVWALFKKDVSLEFALPLFKNWTEKQVLDYIAQYSRWLNSPVSGKYILYHERLRTYVLQKISHTKFKANNEAIINQCYKALAVKAADEWELYGLEHLSAHLLIQAIENKDVAALKKLAYNTDHWNRQVEISKDFGWSKRMLNDMMLWASKFDDEEVIECLINKVDLHHQEQNDAPRIVELVAQNDIKTALQRIEAFGRNDIEGLQRKFILYMLCLMELTLLESKTKPFRKEAIANLLKHLDDNLLVDHSILNWDDFPSYLLFQMDCEWANLGMDYLPVFKRTVSWEPDWLAEKAPYSDLQFDILIAGARAIRDDRGKSSMLKQISAELAKQGHEEESACVMQEALICARMISNESDKSSALAAISTELAKQGNIEESTSAIQEALACARGISNESDKSIALKDISAELAKQGHVEEALACAQDISVNWAKSSALQSISTELAKQGHLEEALTCVRGISDEGDKSIALKNISAELAKQGHLEQALACARGLSYDYWKSSALKDISAELAKQGYIEESASAMQEALACAQDISVNWAKSSALKDISAELAKQGHLEESASAMKEALACTRGISDDRTKSSALMDISAELAKQGHLEESASAMQEALVCARGISDEEDKSNALKDISAELAKQGHLEESASAIMEDLACVQGISADSTLIAISAELAKQGQVEEALACAIGISSDWEKRLAFEAISVDLAKQGHVEEALACARGISNESDKSSALAAISTELAKQGRMEEAESAMQDALACAQDISVNWAKSNALQSISVELAKQGHLEEALACIRGISVESTLKFISTELAKQGHVEEAIACALGISDEDDKNIALKDISAEMAKQGHVEEALACARGLSYDYWKSSALKDISAELAKQSHVEESASAMQEALTCTRGISDEWTRSSVLKDISGELAKQGHVEESAYVMQEALTCARGLSVALKGIATEFAKQGHVGKAEAVGIEIPEIAERNNWWKEIAIVLKDELGWQNALFQHTLFQNKDVQLNYLKQLADLVSVRECNEELILSTRRYYFEDIESMNKLLQQYALHELFFANASNEKISRLNRTLKIQWAIDIKNKFSAN